MKQFFLCNTSIDEARTDVEKCDRLSRLYGSLEYEQGGMNRKGMIKMLKARIRKLEMAV